MSVPREIRSVLVTGGGGGLARALTACEWPAGVEVVALSRTDLDICDAAQVEAAIAALEPAVVINTAAYTRVDLAETAGPGALDVNDRGCEIVSRAAARHDVKLLHVSTDFVFSGALGRPYRESDPTDPLNAYGRSKLRGEAFVMESGADAVVVRTSWLLSGRAGFVPAILTRASRGQALDVVGDQVGTPTDVDDLARALRDIALGHAQGRALRRLYHVAGTGEAAWHEIAEAAVAAWAERAGEIAPSVRPVTSAQWGAAAMRPADSRLDCSAFQSDFGYSLPSWRSRLIDWVTTFERGRA